MNCPVCLDAAPSPFQRLGQLDYWRCTACEATFLDPGHHPSRDAEHAHYLHHENDPDDPRYRKFLAKLSDPLLERLSPNQTGLDYGCGPGPALAAVMREAGHRVALYDPFFAPDPAPLAERYDFITCTEVAEHFHQPAAEFDRLDGMLRPGSWLGVMTCFQTDDAKFVDWHYQPTRRSEQHVRA